MAADDQKPLPGAGLGPAGAFPAGSVAAPTAGAGPSGSPTGPTGSESPSAVPAGPTGPTVSRSHQLPRRWFRAPPTAAPLLRPSRQSPATSLRWSLWADRESNPGPTD